MHHESPCVADTNIVVFVLLLFICKQNGDPATFDLLTRVARARLFRGEKKKKNTKYFKTSRRAARDTDRKGENGRTHVYMNI